ncbi:MAG: hypothetical protein U1E36_01955 [Rickettsiales bacterium]
MTALAQSGCRAHKNRPWFSENGKTKFTFDEAYLGGIAYDKMGTPYPAETLEKAKKADAIPAWRGRRV